VAVTDQLRAADVVAQARAVLAMPAFQLMPKERTLPKAAAAAALAHMAALLEAMQREHDLNSAVTTEILARTARRPPPRSTSFTVGPKPWHTSGVPSCRRSRRCSESWTRAMRG
jgi:hypothetical protein